MGGVIAGQNASGLSFEATQMNHAGIKQPIARSEGAGGIVISYISLEGDRSEILKDLNSVVSSRANRSIEAVDESNSSRNPCPYARLDSNRKIYVTGFDESISNDTLKTYFSRFGQISNIRVPLDKNKKRRGFGFITFETEEASQEATLTSDHLICNCVCSVEKAKSQVQRRKKKQQDLTSTVCDTLCDNKLCMHPDWKCNGKNECGDYSDERSCGSVPIPPEITYTGYSATAFWLCIIAMVIIGVILGVTVPVCFQRYRDSRYRRFHELET